MEEDKKEEIEIVKVTEELIKVKNNSERFASDFAFKLDIFLLLLRQRSLPGMKDMMSLL